MTREQNPPAKAQDEDLIRACGGALREMEAAKERQARRELAKMDKPFCYHRSAWWGRQDTMRTFCA